FGGGAGRDGSVHRHRRRQAIAVVASAGGCDRAPVRRLGRRGDCRGVGFHCGPGAADCWYPGTGGTRGVTVMNLDDLVAIDVHTHAEIAAGGRTSLSPELEAAKAAYFGARDAHP